jgi:endonuclease IV
VHCFCRYIISAFLNFVKIFPRTTVLTQHLQTVQYKAVSNSDRHHTFSISLFRFMTFSYVLYDAVSLLNRYSTFRDNLVVSY